MAERTDGVNREETARMLHEVAERSSRILKEFGQKHLEQSISSAVKDELGIDHFEGRSFRGWHHHVSVVLCCYAFIVAERARYGLPCRSSAPQC
jgi:SRSO17 transposase